MVADMEGRPKSDEDTKTTEEEAVSVHSDLEMAYMEDVESQVESKPLNTYDSWLETIRELLSCAKGKTEKALNELPTGLLVIPSALPLEETLRAVGPEAMSLYVMADKIFTTLSLGNRPQETEGKIAKRREKAERAKGQLDGLVKCCELGIGVHDSIQQVERLKILMAEIYQLSGVPEKDTNLEAKTKNE